MLRRASSDMDALGWFVVVDVVTVPVVNAAKAASVSAGVALAPPTNPLTTACAPLIRLLLLLLLPVVAVVWPLFTPSLVPPPTVDSNNVDAAVKETGWDTDSRISLGRPTNIDDPRNDIAESRDPPSSALSQRLRCLCIGEHG